MQGETAVVERAQLFVHSIHGSAYGQVVIHIFFKFLTNTGDEPIRILLPDIGDAVFPRLSEQPLNQVAR